MARKIKAFWRYLLASVISVLGLSSCNCNRSNNEEIICEYGSPHAVFKVKVCVQDNDGNPVPNATLRLRTHKSGNVDNTIVMSGVTNEKGLLELDEELYYGFEKDEVYLVYRSSDNTSLESKFENDSVKVVPVEVPSAGKSAFVTGTYKTEGTLKLREKP